MRVAVGGTFHPFHEGHRELLRRAVQFATEIHLGLADGPLIAKKGRVIAPWLQRANCATKFLREHGFKGPIYARSITTVDGGVLKGDVDAIVVSKDTIERGYGLAKQFYGIHKRPLEILIADTVYGHDGEPISSTKVQQALDTIEAATFLDLYRRDL